VIIIPVEDEMKNKTGFMDKEKGMEMMKQMMKNMRGDAAAMMEK
jgi:hypothetical protein